MKHVFKRVAFMVGAAAVINCAGLVHGAVAMPLDPEMHVSATTEYLWPQANYEAPYSTGIYLNDDGTLSAQSFSTAPGNWALHLYDGANERIMQTPLAGPVYYDGAQVVNLTTYAQAPADTFGAAIVFTDGAGQKHLVLLQTFVR